MSPDAEKRIVRLAQLKHAAWVRQQDGKISQAEYQVVARNLDSLSLEVAGEEPAAALQELIEGWEKDPLAVPLKPFRRWLQEDIDEREAVSQPVPPPQPVQPPAPPPLPPPVEIPPRPVISLHLPPDLSGTVEVAPKQAEPPQPVEPPSLPKKEPSPLPPPIVIPAQADPLPRPPSPPVAEARPQPEAPLLPVVEDEPELLEAAEPKLSRRDRLVQEQSGWNKYLKPFLSENWMGIIGAISLTAAWLVLAMWLYRQERLSGYLVGIPPLAAFTLATAWLCSALQKGGSRSSPTMVIQFGFLSFLSIPFLFVLAAGATEGLVTESVIGALMAAAAGAALPWISKRLRQPLGHNPALFLLTSNALLFISALARPEVGTPLFLAGGLCLLLWGLMQASKADAKAFSIGRSALLSHYLLSGGALCLLWRTLPEAGLVALLLQPAAWAAGRFWTGQQARLAGMGLSLLGVLVAFNSPFLQPGVLAMATGFWFLQWKEFGEGWTLEITALHLPALTWSLADLAGMSGAPLLWVMILPLAVASLLEYGLDSRIRSLSVGWPLYAALSAAAARLDPLSGPQGMAALAVLFAGAALGQRALSRQSGRLWLFNLVWTPACLLLCLPQGMGISLFLSLTAVGWLAVSNLLQNPLARRYSNGALCGYSLLAVLAQSASLGLDSLHSGQIIGTLAVTTALCGLARRTNAELPIYLSFAPSGLLAVRLVLEGYIHLGSGLGAALAALALLAAATPLQRLLEGRSAAADGSPSGNLFLPASENFAQRPLENASILLAALGLGQALLGLAPLTAEPKLALALPLQTLFWMLMAGRRRHAAFAWIAMAPLLGFAAASVWSLQWHQRPSSATALLALLLLASERLAKLDRPLIRLARDPLQQTAQWLLYAFIPAGLAVYPLLTDASPLHVALQALLSAALIHRFLMRQALDWRHLVLVHLAIAWFWNSWLWRTELGGPPAVMSLDLLSSAMLLLLAASLVLQLPLGRWRESYQGAVRQWMGVGAVGLSLGLLDMSATPVGSALSVWSFSVAVGAAAAAALWLRLPLHSAGGQEDGSVPPWLQACATASAVFVFWSLCLRFDPPPISLAYIALLPVLYKLVRLQWSPAHNRRCIEAACLLAAAALVTVFHHGFEVALLSSLPDPADPSRQAPAFLLLGLASLRLNRHWPRAEFTLLGTVSAAAATILALDRFAGPALPQPSLAACTVLVANAWLALLCLPNPLQRLLHRWTGLSGSATGQFRLQTFVWINCAMQVSALWLLFTQPGRLSALPFIGLTVAGLLYAQRRTTVPLALVETAAFFSLAAPLFYPQIPGLVLAALALLAAAVPMQRLLSRQEGSNFVQESAENVSILLALAGLGLALASLAPLDVEPKLAFSLPLQMLYWMWMARRRNSAGFAGIAMLPLLGLAVASIWSLAWDVRPATATAALALLLLASERLNKLDRPMARLARDPLQQTAQWLLYVFIPAGLAVYPLLTDVSRWHVVLQALLSAALIHRFLVRRSRQWSHLALIHLGIAWGWNCWLWRTGLGGFHAAIRLDLASSVTLMLLAASMALRLPLGRWRESYAAALRQWLGVVAVGLSLSLLCAPAILQGTAFPVGSFYLAAAAAAAAALAARLPFPWLAEQGSDRVPQWLQACASAAVVLIFWSCSIRLFPVAGSLPYVALLPALYKLARLEWYPGRSRRRIEAACLLSLAAVVTLFNPLFEPLFFSHLPLAADAWLRHAPAWLLIGLATLRLNRHWRWAGFSLLGTISSAAAMTLALDWAAGLALPQPRLAACTVLAGQAWLALLCWPNPLQRLLHRWVGLSEEGAQSYRNLIFFLANAALQLSALLLLVAEPGNLLALPFVGLAIAGLLHSERRTTVGLALLEAAACLSLAAPFFYRQIPGQLLAAGLCVFLAIAAGLRRQPSRKDWIPDALLLALAALLTPPLLRNGLLRLDSFAFLLFAFACWMFVPDRPFKIRKDKAHYLWLFWSGFFWLCWYGGYDAFLLPAFSLSAIGIPLLLRWGLKWSSASPQSALHEWEQVSEQVVFKLSLAAVLIAGLGLLLEGQVLLFDGAWLAALEGVLFVAATLCVRRAVRYGRLREQGCAVPFSPIALAALSEALIFSALGLLRWKVELDSLWQVGSALDGYLLLGLAGIAAGMREVLRRSTRTFDGFLSRATQLYAWAGWAWMLLLDWYDQGNLHSFTASLILALLYAWLARRQSKSNLVPSFAFANAALFLLYSDFDLSHPLFYIFPTVSSVLILAHLLRDHLTPGQMKSIRLYCSMALLGSSAFYNLVAFEGTLRYPLVATLVALLGVIAGISLRIRIYLYLGTFFFVFNTLVVLIQIAHFQPAKHVQLLVGLLFLVTGLLFTTGFWAFQTKRHAILQRYEALRGELEDWE